MTDILEMDGEIESFSKEFSFLSSSARKESACSARDPSSISGSGSSPGEGIGNPLQYSCLESPHGQKSLVVCRRAWWLQRVGHS